MKSMQSFLKKIWLHAFYLKEKYIIFLQKKN